jgi:hypothetical protein
MPFEELDDKDIWRLDCVQARYRDLCRRYGLDHSEIVMCSYSLQRRWTAGILRPLTDRIKKGDLAAAEIGIEMMEEDRGLAFGSIIKSNLPRALAKCPLTELQKERIRRRVVAMLLRKFMPKEFRQYAWLIRRIGLGSWQAHLESEADRSHPWVEWYLHYLTEDNPPLAPTRVWSP